MCFSGDKEKAPASELWIIHISGPKKFDLITAEMSLNRKFDNISSELRVEGGVGICEVALWLNWEIII